MVLTRDQSSVDGFAGDGERRERTVGLECRREREEVCERREVNRVAQGMRFEKKRLAVENPTLVRWRLRVDELERAKLNGQRRDFGPEVLGETTCGRGLFSFLSSNSDAIS